MFDSCPYRRPSIAVPTRMVLGLCAVGALGLFQLPVAAQDESFEPVAESSPTPLPIPLTIRAATHPAAWDESVPPGFPDGTQPQRPPETALAGDVVAASLVMDLDTDDRLDSSNATPLAGHDQLKTASSRGLTGSPIASVAGALAMVLGLFLGIAWLSKKTTGQGSHRLPQEVLCVLGHYALGPRQQLQVVRFGNKILAIAVSPNGTECLGELSDADEVARVTQMCTESAPPAAQVRDFLDRIDQVAPNVYRRDQRAATENESTASTSAQGDARATLY